MDKVGGYYYVPKKRKRKRKHFDDEVHLPSDTKINRALKAPINYPEAGMDNAVLPPEKVVSNPIKKWVDKLFQPLTTPDDAIADITTQTFMPTALGWSFIKNGSTFIW